MTELESLIGAEAIAALAEPIESARGLPGAAYCAPGFYRLERERLFPRAWVASALAHEVPSPGDVLPVEVAGWPLVFVRDRRGRLRCFHNICRHRAAAVVLERAPDRRVLRCPWHGWTYALDGSLKGTPEFGGPGCHQVAGFERAEAGLAPVRMAQWFDFLFVNLDGEAPPLEESLRPLTRRLAAFDLDRFRPGGRWETVFAGNWKVTAEGALENYHLPWLHGEVNHGRRPEVNALESAGGCFYALVSIWDEHVGGRRRVAEPRAAELPPLPALEAVTGPDARGNLFCMLFPTGFINVTTDHLYAGTWLPEGPARTRLRFGFYFLGEAASDPAFAGARQHIIEAVQKVFRQDAAVVEAVQERAARRDELGLRTRFSPAWEGNVLRFQRDLVASLS